MIFFFRKSDSDGVPQIVNQYLLPHEKQVIAVHRHPAVFVLHCSILAVACTAASLLTVLTNSSVLVLSAYWGACFIIFVWLIIRVIAWSQSYIAVTSARMIFITGLIAHRVTTVPLAAINELNYRRTRFGLLLGYGVFFADLAHGYIVPDMNFMPYPEQVYLEICSVLFGDVTGEPYEYEPGTEP